MVDIPVPETPTYSGLENDPIFQDIARKYYLSRDGKGYEPKSPKDVVDYFLTDRTWRDLNEVSMLREGYDIAHSDKEQLSRRNYLSQLYRKFPDMWQRGGRGVLPAMTDTLAATMTSPSTYVGGMVGAKVAQKAGAMKGIGAGATTDALTGAAAEWFKQSTNVEAGAQPETDLGEVAAIGALNFGAGILPQAVVQGFKGTRTLVDKYWPSKASPELPPETPFADDLVNRMAADPGKYGAHRKMSGAREKPTTMDELLKDRLKHNTHFRDPISDAQRQANETGENMYDLILGHYRNRYNDWQVQRRGVQPTEVTQIRAQELAEDDAFMQRVFKTSPGQAFNNEEIGAMSFMINDLRRGLRSKLAYMNESFEKTGFNDPELADNVLKTIKVLGMAAGKFRGAQAEAGRSLREVWFANQRIASENMTVEEIEGFLKGRGVASMVADKAGVPKDKKAELQDFVKLLNNITDDSDLFAIAEKAVQPGKADKYREFFINGLLSNPLTWARNAVGNTMVVALETASAAGAVPVGIVRQGIKGALGMEYKATDRVRYNELAAEVYGQIANFGPAMRVAAKAFWDENYVSHASKVEHGVQGAIGGNLGKFTRIPSRVMLGMDAFSATLAEQGRKNREIIKEWNRKLIENDVYKYMKDTNTGQQVPIRYSDLSAPELENARNTFVGAMMEKPSPEILKMMDQEGRHRTFTKPLAGVTQKLLELSNSNTAAGLITKANLPFIRAPLNIMEYGADFVPVMGPIFNRMFLRGKQTGEEFDKTLVKNAMGFMGFGYMVQEGFFGRATGAGPADSKEHELWSVRNQNKAFTYFGNDNKGFNYQALDPGVGMVMALGADVGYYLRRVTEQTIPGMTPEKLSKMTYQDVLDTVLRDEWQINSKDLRKQMMHSVAKTITSKTFFEGIDNMMNFAQSEGSTNAYASKLAASHVPAVVGHIARGIDPIVRAPENPAQAIAARVPMLSREVPARIGPLEFNRRDVYETQNDSGRLRKYENEGVNFVNPFFMTTRKDDPVAKELSALYDQKGLRNLASPQKVIPGSSVELGGQEYRFFNSKRNLLFLSMVEPKVLSPEWKTMEQDMPRLQAKIRKVQLFKQAMDIATKAATAETLRKHPTLLKKWLYDSTRSSMPVDDAELDQILLKKFGFTGYPEGVKR